jgi:uncharacterized protein (DUF302 family)
MKKVVISVLLAGFIAFPVIAAEGVMHVLSTFNVEETADRLERLLHKKGITLFARIKHADNAAKVGVELRQTELLIFGNPKIGSPLMACQQSVAIDLPQKALIWQDDNAQVWISYNDPNYLKKRHAIAACDEALSKIERALFGLSKAAASD